MMPATDVVQLNWSNVVMDTGNYHSTFRSGSHAVMFSDFFGRGKDVGIYHLDDQKRIKTYKFDLDESIVQFGFPYLVSRTRNETIRIWDVNSDAYNPIHELDLGLRGLHRGVVRDGMVFLFSTQNETTSPQHLTVIDCATGSYLERSNLELLDPETAVLFHRNCLILSQLFGAILTIIPIEKGNEARMIQIVGEEDLEDYVDGLSSDDVEDNVIRELVADGDTLVGATNKVIRVWDFQSGELKKIFPIEEPCQLYSVQERFLFGAMEDQIKVWDIESGNTLLQLTNTSSHPIPHCLWYNHKVFHVNASPMPAFTVEFPMDIKVVEEQPKAASDKPSKCTIT